MTNATMSTDVSPAPPSTRRWSPLTIVGAALLGLVLLGFLVAIVRDDGPSHSIRAPLGDVHSAALQVVSGVGSINLRSMDLGNDLYRISTPDGSGQVPTVSAEDGVWRLSLSSAGGSASSSDRGPSSVDIQVNSAVAWQFRLSGGAQNAELDLLSGAITEADLSSGLSTVEMWLPRPHSTVAVRETGGVDTWQVHVTEDVPVRVGLAGGAGTVDIDEVNHTGVAAGRTFSPAGWDTALARYDIQAVGGVSQLTVDRY
jgi:hypothetical protein